MTRQEFIKVFAIIKATYPNNNVISDNNTMEVWYSFLNDLDYGTCAKAVNEYIKNNDFPPSIAGIRKGCTKEVQAFAIPWNEAWDCVMVAVRKYGLNGTKEAMESLDELTKKSVKGIGFYEICTSPNTSYLRREFKDIYEENKKDHDFKVQANGDITGIEDKEKCID